MGRYGGIGAGSRMVRDFCWFLIVVRSGLSPQKLAVRVWELLYTHVGSKQGEGRQYKDCDIDWLNGSPEEAENESSCSLSNRRECFLRNGPA